MKAISIITLIALISGCATTHHPANKESPTGNDCHKDQMVCKNSNAKKDKSNIVLATAQETAEGAGELVILAIAFPLIIVFGGIACAASAPFKSKGSGNSIC